jgi:hypothetical protein
MTFAPFTTNIPFSTNNPSVDQPNMLQNTNSEAQIWPIDHHGFNDSLGGYHTIIHQDPRVANPLAIVGINQIFVKNVTTDAAVPQTDTQLFSLTGGNGLSQLTGNSALSEGYQWLGGTLIFWGSVAISGGMGGSNHRTGTVVFKGRTPTSIPFPNNCFVVLATQDVSSNSVTTNSNTVAIRGFTPLGFAWLVNSSSGSMLTEFPTFSWIAIGN